MIEIKPFKAEDMLWVIQNGVLEINLRAEPNDELRKIAKEREDSGMCVTGWIDGEIIGVSGIDPIWEGVGDVWLMLTPCIYKHLKEGYKCIREGMAKLVKDNNIRRLQSYGRVDFPACHILFKHLGFEVEGLAKAYTPDGCNAIMYAKVK